MGSGPKPVIDAIGLRKGYGDKLVLTDVTLTLHEGERVGLVGNNGCGKSTLGEALCGRTPLEAGTLSLRRGAVVEYLAQEPQFDPRQTVRQVVVQSLASWNRAKEEYERATAALAAESGDTEALVRVQADAGEELERLGGWDRLHEAESILGSLGIHDPARSVDELSGGERRRVALARVLVGAPDLAILDEPTNHLDVATIEWLENYLRNRFTGALLLITHDRYVLDRVANRTLELHRGQVTSYPGGYASYVEAKAERESLEERTERNRQNFLRRELAWLRRQPKARTTKQKARVDRVEAVRAQARPAKERVATLQAESSRLGKTILVLENLAIDRGGSRLVSGLDLRMGAGERIGIIGPNGVGKTSLLLCLLQQLAPSSGTMVLGENTRLGYLDQMRSGLDPEKSVRESVALDQSRVFLGDQEVEVGAYLERFLFDRGVQRMAVGSLSGGERARVCLARLLAQNANLLLLDEPTNDLDVSTLAALEFMLTEYGGCALIVSHDRWFLDRVATSILAFEGTGRVVLHAGNYSEYRARVSSLSAEDAPGGAAAKVRKPRAEPVLKPPGAKLSFAERRELDGIFAVIEQAEEEVRRLEAELADPETYRLRGEEVGVLRLRLEEAQGQVSTLTARWEELEEKRALSESGKGAPT